MSSLTREQSQINQRAIAIATRYKNDEIELIEVLQQVDHLKIHRALGKSSLFTYGTEVLGLEKSIVYALTTIARKSVEVPELKAAIRNKRVTVSKASRIVSTLNPSNANELIEFASKNTRDQIDFEIAKRNPRAKLRDRMKQLSEDVVEVKLTMSRATFEKLKRAESLQAQKSKSMQWGEVVDATLECYLDKHDPVRKADRAIKRAGQVKTQKHEDKKSTATTLDARAEEAPVKKVSIYPVTKPHYERIPLTAAQKHAVIKRDCGRCTHVGLDGKRCDQDKWLDIHHIILVSQGGTNDPENLTTLCGFHHDLAHQMSLPIEGQVTWLRSPRVQYRAQ